MPPPQPVLHRLGLVLLLCVVRGRGAHGSSRAGAGAGGSEGAAAATASGGEINLVVPCYNEARRLPAAEFAAYARQNPRVRFTFVDDGSTDSTLDMLRRLADGAPAGRMQVLALPQNQGKAEATRRGLLQAAASGAAAVGFWDADLATPLSTVADFGAVLDGGGDGDGGGQLQMVFGARVALLGRRIRRDPSRHYLGRVFATLASWVLSLRIYDTQCGAKLFRNTPELHRVIAEPFGSKWIFDVEIIARFLALRRSTMERTTLARAAAATASGGLPPAGTVDEDEEARCWEGQGWCSAAGPPIAEVIYEFPLTEWRDIAGSKIKLGDKFAALWGLGQIWWTYFSPAAAWPAIGTPGDEEVAGVAATTPAAAAAAAAAAATQSDHVTEL